MPCSAVVLTLALAAGPAGWRPADPGHRWEFPRDHHAHPGYRNEWWYLTGTLADAADPGRRFGFQVTFFRVGLAPEPPPLDSAWASADAVMAHLAVTDVSSGRHVFSEVLWRAIPLLGGFPEAPERVLAWARGPPGTDARWSLALDDESVRPGPFDSGAHGASAQGRLRDAGAQPKGGPPGETFSLSARDDGRGVALELTLRARKPVALQGPNGLSRKAEDPAYASLYYSLTRLEAQGTVAVGGAARRVAGEAWMDREVGSSQLAPDQVGWDWWSLRLADGRDLMLYVLRRADGSASWRTATLVERGGEVRALAPEAWAVRATATWTSAASGAVYPARWEIEVPGEGIRVVAAPEIADAENRSALVPGLSYWEGPVRLTGPSGRPAGDGYVELTSYARGARPRI
jgi:predicted secreted hydrolase